MSPWCIAVVLKKLALVDAYSFASKDDSEEQERVPGAPGDRFARAAARAFFRRGRSNATEAQPLPAIADLHLAGLVLPQPGPVLRRWIERYGVPRALYTDWKNVYPSPPTSFPPRCTATAPSRSKATLKRDISIEV